MGLTASSSSNGSKPASVLPIVGHGEYEHVGCADLMIASESDEDTGLFARIFYPASQRSDTVSLLLTVRFIILIYLARGPCCVSLVAKKYAVFKNANFHHSCLNVLLNIFRYPIWKPRREYLDGLGNFLTYIPNLSFKFSRISSNVCTQTSLFLWLGSRRKKVSICVVHKPRHFVCLFSLDYYQSGGLMFTVGFTKTISELCFDHLF